MKLLCVEDINCMLQARFNIIRRQFRIIIVRHLRKGQSFTQQLQHRFNRNPGSCNTRLAEVDVGIY